MPPFARRRAAMRVLSRSKKMRRMEEDEPLPDRISSLPDDVLGDIVSLLPTKDGARTQLLSSRWRHLWGSAPINLDLGHGIYASDISRIISTHHGPVRRFVLPRRYKDHPTAATLDGWLLSPALDNLEELEFRHLSVPPIPLPASVHRFSSTLRVATFSGCSFPADGNNAGSALCLLVLQQMTITNVDILESSLHAMLAACPVLQSLLLIANDVSSRLQIVSPSLRSIGLRSSCRSFALVIEDAPCLERLQRFGGGVQVDISVISAPRLVTLADLFNYNCHRVWFDGETSFQGLTVARMTTMLPSVKDLSLCNVKLSSDAAINLVRCFPHLQRLYIKAKGVRLFRPKKEGVRLEDVLHHENQKLIHTVDIPTRKIMLSNYKGNSRSQIDFVDFFLSNARALDSLSLVLGDNNVSDIWIAEQHKLLDIKKKASRGARVAVLRPDNIFIGRSGLPNAEQVHDLATDPFQRFS